MALVDKISRFGLCQKGQRCLYDDPLLNGWIRILEIWPGAGPMQCSLRTVRLIEAKLNFDALSYVWGSDSSTDRVTIMCNNQPVFIGRNLSCALTRIRDRKESRNVWADAVCINQEDIGERSAQVQQMADIYAAARRVLIWIGDGHPEEAQVCFDLIGEVNALSHQLLAQHGRIGDIPAGAYDASLACIPREAWSTVRHLMEASWFTRVWTIQEVGLARSALLLYGDAGTDWIELVEFMMFVADRPDIARYTGDVKSGRIWDVFEAVWLSFANTESWRDSLSHTASLTETSSDQTFLDIANVARPYKAKDPRDHVYALLGHPSALRESFSTAKIIDVDYSKSVTEVYTSLAAYTITYHQSPWTTLSSVDHVGGPSFLDEQRPSWVPWWDEGWRVYWLGYSTMWYRAGGIEPAMFQAKVLEDNSLHLKGVLFDHVAWVSQPLTAETVLTTRGISTNPIKKVWDALRQCSCISRYGNTRQSEVAFSLVTVAGRARDDGPADKDMPLHTVTYDLTHTATLNRVSSDRNAFEVARFINLDANTFIQNQARALHNRRVFRTLTGYYGICHFNVSVGDLCTVFRGANVPFVLRETAQHVSEEKCYYLVGEAYIQGIMRGEIFSSLLEEDRAADQSTEQNIVIR